MCTLVHELMKLELLALDQIAFVDVNGVPRRSRGCSLRGLEEFNALYEHLQQILAEAEDSQSLGDLYFKDEKFRYCCDRILALNGLQPEWINPTILTALLFAYQGEVGLLVRLNLPNKVIEEGAREGTQNAIAALAAATGNLKDAIELSQSVPWKHLVEAMEGQQEQQKSSLKKDPRSREEVLQGMMSGVSQIKNKNYN